MNNAGYWLRVAIIRELQIQNKATYTIKELDKLYSSVVGDLDAEIKKIFAAYTRGVEISEAEAEQLINKAAQDQIADRLQKILEQTEEPTKRLELIRRIHAQAYGARISRLEAVKLNVYAYFKEKALTEIEKTKNLYNTVIEESYYRTVHDVAKGCNVGINFSLIPKRAVDEMLSAKWHGSQFSEKIWNNTSKAAELAQNIIVTGLLSHKTYNQMTVELAAVSNNSKYNASRLVRTQTNHFMNLGEFKAYEDLGIEKYKYLATLDERTCERCSPLDGKIFSLKDKIEGVNYPTLHPYCRCTTTLPTTYAKRWARDPLSGRGYKIKDMTYNEWIESLTDKQKEAFDKHVVMYRNRGSDKKQYARYIERLGSENVPKTFDKWQNIKYNYPKIYNDYNKTYRSAIGYIEGGINHKTGKARQIIIVNRVEISGIPNSITQFQNKNGGINRNYYAQNSSQVKQISNHNHGNSKKHPFGENGEHAHDYSWDNGNLIKRGKARELNTIEKKENGDIL